MLRRSIFLLLTLLATSAVFAQASHKWSLQYPGDGEREVWIQPSARLGEAPTAPRKVSGKAVDMETTSDPAGLLVLSHDLKTGMVASKDLVEVLKTASWTVQDHDYNRAYITTAEVKSKGLAVASAILNLDMPKEARTALLAPSDKGTIQLYNLTQGDLKVRVTYKVKGVDTTLPSQTFTVKSEPTKSQILLLDVPEGAETLAPATVKDSDPKGTSDPAKKAAEKDAVPVAKPGGGILGFLGQLVSMLIGVAVVGGLAYGVWWYAKNHQNQVQTAMTQVGLNPTSTDPGVGVSLVAPAAQPIQKIVLSGADPGAAIPAASPAGGMPSALAVKNPRLVGEDGNALLLIEGANLVSREAGQIVIPGESSVSRRHAEVLRSGDTLTLMDLGSTNGTFVNGVKLTGSVTLQPGDAVQFGAIKFRFED